MTTDESASIAAHWGDGDVWGRISAALDAAGLDRDRLTIEDLAPLDHFHARGFQATVELADELPIEAGHRLLDIGCGVGGPARYIADRFGCHVSGIDITPPFIEAAGHLTALLGMESQVTLELGDGAHLPYDDAAFDGALSQHVTMNVADRARFFAEAYRVLAPGGFFALTEHGLGPTGDPHHPVPWSEDGSGAHLKTPEETVHHLREAGFTDIEVEETGPRYLAAYRTVIARAAEGPAPVLGTHVLAGTTAPAKTRNAARNIEEGRTRPIKAICRKPA